jgi:shikimate 5-dehydrogenase
MNQPVGFFTQNNTVFAPLVVKLPLLHEGAAHVNSIHSQGVGILLHQAVEGVTLFLLIEGEYLFHYRLVYELQVSIALGFLR